MSKVKKSTNPFYIESNQAFRQVFLVNLNKLSDSSTKKTGLDEIRDLLINQVQDTDRISLVLNLVSENSDHQKSTGKREVMRIIGLMAEVFEDKLASFVPKIISIVSKKLQENDPQIHDTLSASVGNLVSFTLRNLELETAYRDLQSLLTMLVQLCSKSNRYTQVGAAVCIAKVVQSSPFEFLYLMVDDLTLRIVELTRLHVCKAHVQLFECLISLVLAFEGNGEKLAKSATTMLPLAIENLTNSDWNIRKIAVEVIYTLSVLVPEAITPYKHALLDVLGHCRFDKIKNVRDVSLTAIARLKELEDPQNPAQISQLQSNEVPQYQTGSFKQVDTGHGHSASLHRPDEEMGQSKWPSSTVRDPHNGSRPGLKVNPEFFNNAPKHKGDIEIFTKTPPREFIVENNSAAIKKNPVVQEGDPSVQIEESPNKTYKYTVSAKKSPRSEENMFSNRQNVTSEFKAEGQIEEETNKRTSFLPNNRDLPSPPRAKRSPREQTDAKMRAFQNSPGQPDRMEQEEGRREKPRFSDDDFSNVFKQLDHITKQQEKMMESMNNFQNTTLSELKQLKARVKDVEDYVYKSQHTQKAPPAYPYQPPPYGYAPPPYQPFVQPQPQAYPMSYSNYAPGYFYPPGPGMGPNPGRPVDPNWMRRPQGEYPPNQSLQGRQSMTQPTRDRERHERGSPNQNRNDGERIQPELNRVQNRGDPNRENKGHDDLRREHTKKPSKTKMEDRGSKNSIWERLQDLLSRSQVNAAFELCLTEGDEETLIALMKETGVIVEYLENPIVENILTGLKSRVFDEAHRDLMLNWIEKSTTTDAGVSRGTFIALHDILIQLLEEGTGLNHASTEKVKKIIGEIQQLLDNQPEESEPKNLAPKEDDEMENEITDEREGTEGNEIK